MNWLALIGLVVLGSIAVLLFWYRRERRLTLTRHTLQCPEHDCRASVAVRTDPVAYPSFRYVDVTACSLLPPRSFVPPVRRAYFADPTPPESYLCDVDQTPCHSDKISCSKPCLLVLNAAESGTTEPIRCTSGMSDGLELVRQTQGPALTRVLWYHGT